MTFALLTLLTLTGALGAVLLRNLLHCALALTVAFIGLAAFYLHLGAQFAGFAQILVYVGAVAVLVLFAILLTGGAAREPGERVFSNGWLAGLGIAASLFTLFAGCILASRLLDVTAPAEAPATVRQIGETLMTRYVLALQVVGLLLTAALMGAVLLAAKAREAE